MFRLLRGPLIKSFSTFLKPKIIPKKLTNTYLYKSNYAFSFIKNLQMQVDEQIPKEKTVTCLSAKEMKNLIRPVFQQNPEKFYPVETFKKMGFSRAHCKCGHYYWRKSENVTNCGDSHCVGKYSFIGKGCGIGRQGKKLTYVEAWQAFKKSLTTARIPSTAIDRYPVIARWRNDVDYVAAGIFCFQPYCVTGELQPPANPLICPQFCLRFNDLDNIGLTGRHYSGFVMQGIQVFNKPGEYKFFKDECLEFNYNFLTEELKIDPEEITFIEDVWAGGGNLGPSIQYFIGGLQVGNMVFTQYRYDNEGKYEELAIKIIDVGVGLERVPWVVNGSPTSYYDVFTRSFEFLKKQINIELHNQIWEKIGPYTCKLNIDETDDIERTWKQIEELSGVASQVAKKAILPVKELYVILDHTRTALIIIQDGGLPSNTGGGSNCRNILRRVFAILKKNDWWSKIGGIDGLLKLFEYHKEDLTELYGKFAQYKSFGNIIKIQYERWSSTQVSQKKKVQQHLVKKKGKFEIDDWILAMQTWGVPADVVAQVCKSEIPGNLYAQIALRAQKVAKAQEMVLYETMQFPQTQNLYYIDHKMYEFDAKVVGVLKNAQEKTKGQDIVLLDRSAFYPTSGGQVHDTGVMKIGQTNYNVVSVEKVGRCFLHHLDHDFTNEKIIGLPVKGFVDEERRSILRSFHTGTHIVYAAARRVLGPHVWQHGAKKTIDHAHIDITHYSSLTKDLQMKIENEANKIILEGHPIKKYFEKKDEAEKQFGFNLYQGGIVPGNTIRVVNIEGVDAEACCGTHADNTSQVGWIKLKKTLRVSDGILRLYYVAGKKVMNALNEETTVINSLKDLWGIKQDQIVGTANRFFNDYKRFEKETQNQKLRLLEMSVLYMCENATQKFALPTLQKQMTLYVSCIDTHLLPIIEKQKTIFFVNDYILFAIVSKAEHIDIEKLKTVLKEDEDPEIVDKKFSAKKGIQYGKGKNKKKKEDAYQIKYSGKIKEKKVMEYLMNCEFRMIK